MTQIGIFLVIERDPLPFLHASALVAELRHVMPDVPIVQLTNMSTDRIPGTSHAVRLNVRGPILGQRLQHYAALPEGDWLLLDTDISARADVQNVFFGASWDVALCDRHWPETPQGEAIMHTMPFNSGVVFSRSQGFWHEVAGAYAALPREDRESWTGEQRAIYDVVRSGRFRVKILPGQTYNYPPIAGSPLPPDVAFVHYKGPRKTLLTPLAYATLAGTAP